MIKNSDNENLTRNAFGLYRSNHINNRFSQTFGEKKQTSLANTGGTLSAYILKRLYFCLILSE